MNQLLLDLGPPPRPRFENFLPGRNPLALEAVMRLCAGPVADPPARCLYLWGEAASGRTHLLKAACERLDGRYLAGADATPEAIRAAIAPDPDASRWLLAVDDVAACSPDAQEALFHALNAMRQDERAAVLVSGDVPPRDLPLAPGRDDLRTRLGWGLAFPLLRLDDAEKDAALARRADETGFPLPADVRRYLMTHFARDLGSLMRTVDALDLYAREHRRVVTVPLIRDFLQRPIDFEERVGHEA